MGTDFASARTKQLLHCFDIDSSFHQLSPELWADNENYIRGKQRLMKLRVVSDNAERGVKLFQEYNLSFSRHRKETQLILQVVEANRKELKALTIPV